MLREIDIYTFYFIKDQMNYSLNELIGKGAFGKVFLGEHRETGELVAIKVIPYLKKNINRINREMEIPRLFANHKNIASFIEAKRYGNKIYIISEYITNGITLEKWKLPDLTTREGLLVLLDVMYELADAYDYIHQQGVAHRDVKPRNILMKGNVPIIIDWDLACLNLPDSPFPCKGLAGTPNYLAPELWNNRKNIDPFLTDIYSLGVVFYYLANRKQLPYIRKEIEDVKRAVLEGNPIPSSSGNDRLDELIMLMIQTVPEERISLDDVKNNLQILIKTI